MRLIALIDQPEVIRRILRHLGSPVDVPAPAPARAPPLAEDAAAGTCSQVLMMDVSTYAVGWLHRTCPLERPRAVRGGVLAGIQGLQAML